METEILNWIAPVFQGGAKAMSILTVLVAVVLTHLLRVTPKIENSLIGWVVIPAASYFFTLVGDRSLVPDNVPLGNPRTAALAGYGIVLGFLALLLEAQIINRIRKRLKSTKYSGDSDPNLFTKPPDKP